jgi:hypothetical protein
MSREIHDFVQTHISQIAKLATNQIVPHITKSISKSYEVSQQLNYVPLGPIYSNSCQRKYRGNVPYSLSDRAPIHQPGAMYYASNNRRCNSVCISRRPSAISRT